MSKKVLILRFSSLGDVTQTLSAAYHLHQAGFIVHWATRIDLASVVKACPFVHQVWQLERRRGLFGLIELFFKLRREKFNYIYDAHDNLRSNFIYWGLMLSSPLLMIFKKRYFLKRPFYRWRRWYWIRFKKNILPLPLEAQLQILLPLKKWHVPLELPPIPLIQIDSLSKEIVTKELNKHHLSSFIALCPSAAYPLKRWPLEHWMELIRLATNHKFVILGGPKDHFLENLVYVDPNRVFNFAGRLSLLESAAMIEIAQLVITNDTGLMHIAEQLLKPTIALIGPSLSGYPLRHQTSTWVLEKQLPCRPCSRHGQGICYNPQVQECLTSISPQDVYHKIQQIYFT